VLGKDEQKDSGRLLPFISKPDGNIEGFEQGVGKMIFLF
jgi:hypothetical protein